ncbi:hypothetical protein DH2020_004674 [Rehmannia glutinosa]|uniref:Uncharacterized protein n=1 Tax=Rehmannia glutinosa TaxID=99300 RepID=A0ABR0XQC8_REHGL
MADPASYGNPDRDIDQDETTLIWYSHGAERHLTLSSVSRIIPGQRTICKDKVESEVWLAGLKALISTGQTRSRRTRSEIYDLHGTGDIPQEIRPFGAALEFTSSIPRGKVSTDFSSRDNNSSSSSSHVGSESANMQLRTSGADGFRISVSSTPSCSSQGSGPDDIESLGDVYLWGEIWSDGVATDGTGNPIPIKNDVLAPKPLETNIVLDVHQIACGVRHVALVTRQGEVFTWGEESGGRLGHGIEKDFCRPRLVESLAITNIDFVSCGEFHTCALSASGDLYTWGDGTHNVGLLGHGNDVSHWIPKRVCGSLEGFQVLSVACGTWHSALATSNGKLFTFGDGMFGALGHGDRESIRYPKEVQSLSGLKAVAVSCGVWHTAAIIEVSNQSGPNVSSRKLFTWGDGDKYRLGHGNKETYLFPTCVSGLIDYNIQQIACGANMTVALTNSGHVFTMGSNVYGQLGSPQADGKSPILVQDRLVGEFVEQISCGAYHVAVLTLRSEVFTWGRGANGRLGHGDTEDRNAPTLVEALKDRHVRNIACGSNYTASICIHKWVSGADQSVCTACRQAFGFTRKRHNCYNCGLVHCHGCSSKKAMKAALAPTPGNHTERCKNVHEFYCPHCGAVKYLEIKSGSSGQRSDNYSIVRASQVPSLLQLKDIAFPSSLSALQYALKPVITSSPQPQQPQPQYQSNSRPASPYSRRPSPPRSAAPVFSRGVIDTLKKTNDILNQEVSKLHGQVKSLKQKSEVQDAEIQKLKETAESATALAADRSSTCIRAMRAVKTITDQLKEITDKLPPEISESETFKSMQAQVESFLDNIGVPAFEDNSAFPPELTHEEQNRSDQTALANEANFREDHVNVVVPQNADRTNEASTSNTNGTNQSSTENGSGASHGGASSSEGQKEVIEQFEPGVYVTLLLLANGTKIFKRVRFSKRRFDEHQAEEWWKDNKDRLLKKYSPPKTTRTSVEAAPAQPPADDDNQPTQENKDNEAAQFS